MQSMSFIGFTLAFRPVYENTCFSDPHDLLSFKYQEIGNLIFNFPFLSFLYRNRNFEHTAQLKSEN